MATLRKKGALWETRIICTNRCLGRLGFSLGLILKPKLEKLASGLQISAWTVKCITWLVQQLPLNEKKVCVVEAGILKIITQQQATGWQALLFQCDASMASDLQVPETMTCRATSQIYKSHWNITTTTSQIYKSACNTLIASIAHERPAGRCMVQNSCNFLSCIRVFGRTRLFCQGKVSFVKIKCWKPFGVLIVDCNYLMLQRHHVHMTIWPACVVNRQQDSLTFLASVFCQFLKLAAWQLDVSGISFFLISEVLSRIPSQKRCRNVWAWMTSTACERAYNAVPCCSLCTLFAWALWYLSKQKDTIYTERNQTEWNRM